MLKEAKLQSKIDLVNEIKEKIEGSHSMVFINYRGLTVEEVTELRKNFRENDVVYKVYKNTMMKRAFQDLGIEGLDDFMKGPTAVAFGMEDAVAPAKVASEYAKDHEVVEIKAGYVDGKIIDTKGVEALAKLPSREVLIAQVLGGLNAPITGLVSVLNGNIRGLAVALRAIAEKKEQESA